MPPAPCEVHWELQGPERAPLIVLAGSLGTDLSSLVGRFFDGNGMEEA